MNSKKSYVIRSVLLMSDLVVLNLSYCFALCFFAPAGSYAAAQLDSLALLLVDNMIWLCFAMLFNLYRYRTAKQLKTIHRSTWCTLAAAELSFWAVLYALHPHFFGFAFMCCCMGSRMLLLLGSRLMLIAATEAISRTMVTKTKVLVVGDTAGGKQLANYFTAHRNFYSLAGVFHDDQSESEDALYRGPLEACVDYATHNKVNYIYSTLLPEDNEHMLNLQQQAEERCIRMLFVAKGGGLAEKKYYHIHSIEQMPVLSLRAQPLEKQKNRIRKRLFDIVVSSLVILFVMIWLTPLFALLIKLSSKGPVFFIQKRSGKNNQPFSCLKFRSMRVNENSDSVQATRNDSRITRLGAFMRKTSIDELPQFFNVWIGNMSIVGPRPHMLRHTEEYSAIISKYLVRQYLHPGITGWAQVNGYRGETTNVEQMEKRVKHDIQYMENWSLSLDARIVCMTVGNMLKGEENAW